MMVAGGSLVSGSLDKTLRIWNVVEASHAEPIELTDEVLDVCYSPSGTVIAVSFQIYEVFRQFWSARVFKFFLL